MRTDTPPVRDRTPEVAVVGSGPAGTLAALLCARAGLEVVWISPSFAPWTARYGLWADELSLLPEPVVARTWERTTVHALGERELGVAYTQLDAAATALKWRQAALDLGVRRIEARAQRLESHRVELERGYVEARAVVDARGAAPGGGPVQSAFGWHATVDGHPFGEAARLMDWRGDGATFLYALPLGPDELFVEETVLRGPPMPSQVLRSRLAQRLRGLGVSVRAVHAEERCLIPLGVPPSRRLALGLGAGMVQPVSGYLLPRVALAAGALADALAHGRDPLGATWSRSDRWRHRLHMLAARFLDRLPVYERAAWFDRFFGSPQDIWRPLLSPVAPPGQVAASMARLFVHADASTQARMLLSLHGITSKGECP